MSVIFDETATTCQHLDVPCEVSLRMPLHSTNIAPLGYTHNSDTVSTQLTTTYKTVHGSPVEKSNQNKIANSESSLPTKDLKFNIPEDFVPQPFNHQVSGRHLMFSTGCGYICKEVRTESEMHFYQKLVQEPDNPFHNFVAKYLGNFSVPVSQLSICPAIKLKLAHLIGSRGKSQDINNINFFALEDLTYGMQLPCVADIKIGQIQCPPDATLEKRRSKMQKTKQTTSYSLGLRLCGTKVWNSMTMSFEEQDKYQYRKLKAREMQPCLTSFFDNKNGEGPNVKHLNSILKKLNDLRKVFETQTHWHFITSSLVLIYDAGDSNISANVAMVDFGYAIEAKGQTDENYLHGLINLIGILECIQSDTIYEWTDPSINCSHSHLSCSFSSECSSEEVQ
eukprot:NODE_1346_length_2002_cov_29.432145_g1139_i0.p1 GENE.NODE_1346_length_2002_cov_29.432145_g1139_i0~~NODE_1346_length_2002_cov_29.432145_g1139_i0.p1  ORF type:complete len:394 (-),score=40.65 NODE_1346_length_2002_cov_29.432145_g1139_i0:709-1890(-)